MEESYARAVAAITPGWLESSRWFGGKGREVVGVDLADALTIPGSHGGHLLLVGVRYADGGDQTYTVPAWISRAGWLTHPAPGDGLWLALVEAMCAGAPLAGLRGTFVPRLGEAADRLAMGLAAERDLALDQSNTSLVLGERLVAKCYRRVEPGPHPEIELVETLCRGTPFPHVPALAGSLSHRSPAGVETGLLLLQGFVPGAEDGWEAIIGRVCALFRGGGALEGTAVSAEVADAGMVAARLHVALADRLGWRAATAHDLRRFELDGEVELKRALALLDGDDHDELQRAAPRIRAGLAALTHAGKPPLMRIHGDLHYAQILRAPDGPFVVDLEGEPSRSIAERRAPGSPLRDLACLTLSLDHVGRAAARRVGDVADAVVERFVDVAIARCIAAYEAELAALGAPFRVDRALLHALSLAKESAEFVYARQFLPAWLYAPRGGMRRLLAA